MNGSVLLDTNIVINFFRNDATTVKQVALIKKVFVPSIVMGELFFGAHKSANPQKHITQIEQFKPHITILSVDEKTAIFYGQIKNHLKQIGNPIPENDIWIAAITQQYQLPLMTKDRHFQIIPDISIV